MTGRRILLKILMLTKIVLYHINNVTEYRSIQLTVCVVFKVKLNGAIARAKYVFAKLVSA